MLEETVIVFKYWDGVMGNDFSPRFDTPTHADEEKSVL
jgi:hypothetical protein